MCVCVHMTFLLNNRYCVVFLRLGQLELLVFSHCVPCYVLPWNSSFILDGGCSWESGENKSRHFSSAYDSPTILIILDVFNNSVVLIKPLLHLISCSSSIFRRIFRSVTGAPITNGTSAMFQRFISFLLNSKYLSIFSLSFILSDRFLPVHRSLVKMFCTLNHLTHSSETYCIFFTPTFYIY